MGNLKEKLMSKYPQFLYARFVNPDSVDQFLLTGSEVSDVSDTAVADNDTVSTRVARYKLVGLGEIHHTAPAYVEDITDSFPS